MYLSRPIRRTRSTSSGTAPNPRRFSTWTIVLSSAFAGTAADGPGAAAMGLLGIEAQTSTASRQWDNRSVVRDVCRKALWFIGRPRTRLWFRQGGPVDRYKNPKKVAGTFPGKVPATFWGGEWHNCRSGCDLGPVFATSAPSGSPAPRFDPVRR